MKQSRYSFFVFSLAVLSLLACSREAELPEPLPERQMKQLILSASVESDSETRTVLRDRILYWQPGDQVSLFYGPGTNGGSKFTSIDQTETLSAQFSGMIDIIEGGSENAGDLGGKKFIGVYPYRDDIVCDGSTITTTLPDVQTAVEGSFDRNLFISMGRSSGLEMKFYNVCSGLFFTISHPNICQIEFSGNAGEVLAGDVKVGFDANGKPEVKQVLNGKTKITLIAPNGGEFEVGKTYCLVSLPVQMTASMKAVFIKTDASSGLRKWQTRNITFGRNQLLTYTPLDADAYTTFFDAVDLGGSVLWATKNVGAAEVGDYGEFYRWGEITPYSGGSSYSGASSTNNMALSPEDDAASANWGGYWRTPTASELMELSSMSQGLDTENNHSGIRFGDGSNSIFVPFSGIWIRNSSDVWYQNTFGYLMSSEKDNENQLVLLSLYNTSGNVGSSIIYGSGYDNGYSVRPVLSKPVAATTVVLDKTSVRMNVGATEQLTAMVLPDNAFRKGVTWDSSNQSVAYVDATGKVTATGVGTATIIATSVMNSVVSAFCEVTVIQSESMEYVIMGPGQFWATCNVGAELPTDAGTLFAWGETEPKDAYKWSNYRWQTPNYFSKYQALDENYSSDWYELVGAEMVYVGDGKSLLDPEDDAAIANWNNEWHTPTKAEWSWLLANCSWEPTTEDGVSGVRVTSQVEGYTNSSIFLPSGTAGCYWSSSLCLSASDQAHRVSVNGTAALSTWYRKDGYMIRPVHSPMVHVTEVSLDQSALEISAIGETQTLTATVTPSNALEPSLIWSSSNPSVATVSQDGVVTGVSYGAATITVTAVDGRKSASCEVYVTAHVFVEMGPGQVWATCNVGATNPEDKGNLYAWGETATKDYYAWNNYTWLYNSEPQTIWKYQFPDGNHGGVWYTVENGYLFVFRGDGKGVLELEDDSANVNWGGSWRTPTRAEWQWLKTNCTWVWDSAKSGYWVTSKVAGYEDRQIFLPGSDYWSSTIDGEDTKKAHMMSVNATGENMSTDLRCDSKAVRPVCSSRVSVTNVSLDQSSMTVNGLVVKYFFLSASVSPSNATEKGVVWTSSNPSVAAVYEGMVSISSSGTTTITATTLDGCKTATCEVTVDIPISGSHYGHDWVDLGDGHRWATLNVGAERESDYGDYFAWGETDTKSTYTEDNYYVTTVSFKDTAKKIWGLGWRMPTEEDWEWLINNCDWAWTSVPGPFYATYTNGHRVTSRTNGQSIFLPAAGTFNSEHYEIGRYWSSTYDPNNTSNAYQLGGGYISSFPRFNGCSIRPVLDE